MEKLIYLDNGSTTFPKPQEVYDFMHNFYMTNGISPGRSGYNTVIKTEEVLVETRKMLMEMFNGDGDINRLTFS
jgi:selenocysteine lyase/cysteine desulfurase